ncbi:MAG: single-stranded DNA-binding protein [Clostridia bacterium]|nr:single-stranded DNA-binding protein [Clostridia bacterium]
MNKVIMMGRFTKDPDIRAYGSEGKSLASFSIAVDRRFKRDGEPSADFFNCTAFGSAAGVIEKYMHKGTKVLLDGELQNNNYEDKNGVKQYGQRILVNSIEFAESKKNDSSGGKYDGQSKAEPPKTDDNGWMNVPDDTDEELPFN